MIPLVIKAVIHGLVFALSVDTYKALKRSFRKYYMKEKVKRIFVKEKKSIWGRFKL